MDANTMLPEPASPVAAGDRELEAAHEIAQAFLSATQPVEVYRLALARLTATVRADFAAVFLRDDSDPELLRPVCLHGWPQASARFLGEMRIRVGQGPTGRAVAGNSPVEVGDIFADETLVDWWEPARELGFAAMITMPLVTPGGVAGAVSFYFAESRTFTNEERRLLKLISEHLAATTVRSGTVAELRVENDRLRSDIERLTAAVQEAESRSRSHDHLLAGVGRDLRSTLQSLQSELEGDATVPGSGANALAERAGRIVDDLVELVDLRLGRARMRTAPEDAARLLRLAVEAAGPTPPGVEFTLDAADSIIPMMTDGPRVVRAITTLLRDAFRSTARGRIGVRVAAAQDESGQWVDWTVVAHGMGIDDGRPSGAGRTEREHAGGLEFTLAETIAHGLGGEVSAAKEPGSGSTYRLHLPRHRDG